MDRGTMLPRYSTFGLVEMLKNSGYSPELARPSVDGKRYLSLLLVLSNELLRRIYRPYTRRSLRDSRALWDSEYWDLDRIKLYESKV